MAKAKTVEIITRSGFKCRIDPTISNDMEIIDEFTQLINGTADYVPGDFVVKLIGEAQKAALYEHHRDEKTGRVQADKVGPDIADIMNEAAKALKK